MSKIKIILAESSDVMVYGLTHLLFEQSDIEIVGKATRYNHLCQLIEDVPHHIVIIGPLMIEKYSHQIVEYIINRFPDINLIELDDKDNQGTIIQKIQSSYKKIIDLEVEGL